MLGGGREAERIDRHVAVMQSHAPRGAAELTGQILVAAAEVENKRDGHVLLCVREEEVQEKGLSTARGSQDERVAHVPVVEIPVVRRLMFCLKHGQAVAAKVLADAFAPV